MRAVLRSLLPASRVRLCAAPRTRNAGLPSLPARRTMVSAADLQFGQPLHETHPHLLKPGEITPGISALEYAQRRAKLAKALPPRSVAIVAASDIKYRSGAVFYDFHQDSDFLYLTGFKEPEAVAIIEKPGDGAEHQFHLYCRPKDPKAELWDGARSGIQAAEDVFNADIAGDINKLHYILPDILKRNVHVFTDLPKSFQPRTAYTHYLSGLDTNRVKGFPNLLHELGISSVKPLRQHLNEIRLIKSPAEIANMRRAGQASGRAFTAAMSQGWDTEAALAAFLDYRFKVNGCEAAAYVPVVAGGENALSIHYVRNDARLPADGLVLVDAGGQHGGYITDITRTWPVSGRFTAAQRDLYAVVLAVQRSVVSLCRADAGFTLDRLHRVAETGLRDGLAQLGFDFGRKDRRIEDLFPHHVGHYVGLDVHDCPGVGRNRALQPGMCVTVEPGIYIGAEDDRWPAAFRGIGIRIEDSVAVDAASPFVLTTEAVKEIVDIEELRED